MRMFALLLLSMYFCGTAVNSQSLFTSDPYILPDLTESGADIPDLDSFSDLSAGNRSILPVTMQSFYEADWSRTRTLIQELKKKDGSDPLPYFLSAMIPFWTYFFGGNEPDVAREFLELSSVAIKIGENRLEVTPTDTSAILLLSGLHGYRSLVAAREKQYRIAMSSGITGYSYTKTLLKMDDDDPNTLMGQGVFHYMVGSIPIEVRWMARLAGLNGNKDEGLELLERAALADSHVSNDARMFLSHLYEQEGRYKDAYYHLQILSEKYPSNIIFHYNLARMYEANQESLAAVHSYKKVLSTPTAELDILQNLALDRLRVLQSASIENTSY